MASFYYGGGAPWPKESAAVGYLWNDAVYADDPDLAWKQCQVAFVSVMPAPLGALQSSGLSNAQLARGARWPKQQPQKAPTLDELLDGAPRRKIRLSE